MDTLSREETVIFTVFEEIIYFNPIALRKTKIVFNFGLSECNSGNLRVDLFWKDFAKLVEKQRYNHLASFGFSFILGSSVLHIGRKKQVNHSKYAVNNKTYIC